MKKILGLLVTAFMLTASALAADLDTPQIGAAICAPEEADGSVVLHEAPDGRSETLMRYFRARRCKCSTLRTAGRTCAWAWRATRWRAISGRNG